MNQNLSPKQFAPPPVEDTYGGGPAAILASRDQPMDVGWADRDIDPVITSKNEQINVAPLSAITQHATNTNPAVPEKRLKV